MDHAHADEHIGENDSGAALNGHDARRRFASRSVERIASRVHALNCFLIFIMDKFGSARPPVYFCITSEAARTINLRSSRSKRFPTVRNSCANASKAALVSSSLVL
jgi:hypothetical protein